MRTFIKTDLTQSTTIDVISHLTVNASRVGNAGQAEGDVCAREASADQVVVIA